MARGAAAVLAPEGTIWPDYVPARPFLTDPEPRQRLAQLAAAPTPPAKASPPVAALPRPSIPTASQPGAAPASAPRDMRREASATPTARGEITTVAARREAGTLFSGAAVAVR